MFRVRRVRVFKQARFLFMMKIFSLIGTKRANQQPVLIVSGLPRSGTSLMMMMLKEAGIELLTDHARKADEDNPKGYYELERVKKLKDGDTAWLEGASGKAVKVISALLPSLPNKYAYKVIFMRRDMAEILASQHKMLINRGEDPKKIDDEEIGASFEKHLAKTIEWLGNQPNFTTLFVNYNLLLTEPAPQVAKIGQFLGDDVDSDRMIAAIDLKLHRQKKEEIDEIRVDRINNN